MSWDENSKDMMSHESKERLAYMVLAYRMYMKLAPQWRSVKAFALLSGDQGSISGLNKP